MTALKQLTKPPQQHSNTPKSTQIALDTTTTAYDSTTSATTTGPHWHSTATRLPQNHHNIRQHQHSHSTATALAQNYHNSCPHHHCAHYHKPPKHRIQVLPEHTTYYHTECTNTTYNTQPALKQHAKVPQHHNNATLQLAFTITYDSTSTHHSHTGTTRVPHNYHNTAATPHCYPRQSLQSPLIYMIATTALASRHNIRHHTATHHNIRHHQHSPQHTTLHCYSPQHSI